MSRLLVLTVLFCFINVVVLQGTGSGTDGNLRLCIVEGRGSYKRGSKYCPILDAEKSGIECVIGTDRLDCLRRMHKKTVDFGAFAPEDLVAAQWADVDVLVTNELRRRNRPFARSIVALVNRRIFDNDEETTVSSLLRNRTLCHPAVDADDLRPLSETLARYLELLVTAHSCDPKYSLTENRIKVIAEFFGKACMAGPWVPNPARDAELKRRYPSLCAACSFRRCDETDRYWGDTGSLNCMADAVGDVTWAELDDVQTYFQLYAHAANQFVFLCRDGTHRALNDTSPCVWLQQPWNVIVAKRKSAEAVGKLTSSLTNSSVVTDQHWRGALAALLEVPQQLSPPLQPPQPPMDYLSNAYGFTEAYSTHGCDVSRHITLCTTSILANNKCNWLAEAGAVYGIAPPLQCSRRDTVEQCMESVKEGSSTVVIADSDWLALAKRNYSLVPLLHEATPIIDKMHTVAAYIKLKSGKSDIKTVADLRGKRAAFPRFDGMAFHTVMRYLKNDLKSTCKDVSKDFFSEICAPGVESYNVSQKTVEKYTKNCKKDNGKTITGELEALRSLVEDETDVAFISRNTFNMYKARVIHEPWAIEQVELAGLCPEKTMSYCLFGWSNIGHVFAKSNLTEMRRNEVINVLTKLDQLFGNHAHRLMFSMYGPYNHELNVLFHNNTRALLTDEMFGTRPYTSTSDFPLNFEISLNSNDSICNISDFTTDFGFQITPGVTLVISLMLSLLLS